MPEQRIDVRVSGRIYVCEMCGKLGAVENLRGECGNSGWTHGRLIRVTSATRDALARLGVAKPTRS